MKMKQIKEQPAEADVMLLMQQSAHSARD